MTMTEIIAMVILKALLIVGCLSEVFLSVALGIQISRNTSNISSIPFWIMALGFTVLIPIIIFML